MMMKVAASSVPITQLARVMSKERFVACILHRFLVLDAHVSQIDDLGYDTAFVDGLIGEPDIADGDADHRVLELVKRHGNPFMDRISIGRASNCDVVLNDSSVSKLHAHIRESDGELHLSDVDSQNGTQVNGVRLEPHEPTALKIGDRVRFGSVAATVADAAMVYDLVIVGP